MRLTKSHLREMIKAEIASLQEDDDFGPLAGAPPIADLYEWVQEALNSEHLDPEMGEYKLLNNLFTALNDIAQLGLWASE